VLAVVMPPATDLRPDDAVDRWTAVHHTCRALHARGDVVAEVHGRHATTTATVERDGVRYVFHTSDRSLADAVGARRPDAVLVHGLGWSRLLHRLRGVGAPILVQHHGERVFTGRARWGHRLVRRHLAGYLFTGVADGQARPWVDAGVIATEAPLFEVLEAAPMLPDDDGEPIHLEGRPAVLWVGRLIEGKDPLTAIDGFLAADLPEAHLHVLATDRFLEPEVRARLTAAGEPARRVHLHDAVPHDRIGAWFAAADVYLSTSRSEAAGFSLLEALSRGCVPVVSDIAPNHTLLGDVGVRFPVGDPTALAVALNAAVSMSRERSLHRSRSVHTWARVADQLVEAMRAVREPRE
jgi:glycosyltransferase involved in cell wall biosynthesis